MKWTICNAGDVWNTRLTMPPIHLHLCICDGWKYRNTRLTMLPIRLLCCSQRGRAPFQGEHSWNTLIQCNQDGDGLFDDEDHHHHEEVFKVQTLCKRRGRWPDHSRYWSIKWYGGRGRFDLLTKAWRPPLQCRQWSVHCLGDTNTWGIRYGQGHYLTVNH